MLPPASAPLSRLLGSLALLGAIAASGADATENWPVAGLAPYERPAGAPVLREFARPPAWTVDATRGIAQPLPAGLRFIADQGAWYTPFTRPGMPGRYDIRHLHDNKTAAQ